MLSEMQAGASVPRFRTVRWWPRFREDGRPAPWPAVAMAVLSSLLFIPVAAHAVSTASTDIDWPFVVLLAAALVTPFFSSNFLRRQVFVLIGPTCVMAAVLLPLSQALAVSLVATGTDFVRRRYLPGSPGTLAGISGFSNAVTYLWAASACSEVATTLSHGSELRRGLLPLAAAAAFVGTSESSFATYIHLGFGYRLRDLLKPRSLSIELALACLGADAALLWRFQPWATLAVIPPLAVLRAALQLPLLEERARLADLERSAKERLQELDRMKREFVASVSHELRTPIISIGGYTELILEGMAGEVSDDQRQHLEVVRRNSERLSRLVDDLVLIDEVESGLVFELAVVDLHRIAREAAAAAAAKARDAGLTIEVTSEGSSLVRGDHGRLGQVLDNLISNAMKYAPAGGVVDVRVRGDRANVTLEVEDHGPGIAPHDQARLFDRFYRTSSAKASDTPGSGLGLSIVKSIIEQHHGEVSVASTLGSGTILRVVLPPLPESAAAPTQDHGGFH